MAQTLPNLIVVSEVLPYGIQTICAACAQAPASRETLKLMMTNHVGGSTEVFDPCFNAALAFALLEEKNGKAHALVAPDQIPQGIRAGLAAADNSFTRAARFFLAKDPWSVPERAFSDWQKTEINQEVTNSTQWGNYSRWMQFLGLAVTRATRLIPDPTEALSESLQVLLTDKQPVKAQVFLSEMQKLVPLPADLHDDSNTLIPSVSFALKALEQRKALTFVELSDTQKFSLKWPSGLQHFTHVQRGGK